MEHPPKMPALDNMAPVEPSAHGGHKNKELGEAPPISGVSGPPQALPPAQKNSDNLPAPQNPQNSVQNTLEMAQNTHKKGSVSPAEVVGDSCSEPHPKRFKPEPEHAVASPHAPSAFEQTNIRGQVPGLAPPQPPFHLQQSPPHYPYAPGHYPPPPGQFPYAPGQYPPTSMPLPGQMHPGYFQPQFQPVYNQSPPAVLQPGSVGPQLYTQSTSFTPSVTTSVNMDASAQAEPFNKKQVEKLEKQKQREAERASKELQRAEQLRIKKEEREKKEIEKKLKKEALEAEKELKREQEKLRKEEKRRKQEEDKARKEHERKKKEEEKEEERRKEEERKKKEERNQMKISNFFTVKKIVSAPPGPEPAGSIAEDNKKRDVSHYESDFLPFFQKQNVTMPSAQLLPQDAEYKKRTYDEALAVESQTVPSLKDMFPKSRSNETHTRYTTSEELVEALNSSQTSPKQLYQLVQNLPHVKYLQFYENAKPPYVGTWCSKKHLEVTICVADPLDKSKTGFDYDYDSDLDWQDNDEGEGEDLGEGEDGDEEDDDVDEDEMEDFVDNNDSTKKRSHIGPLQSICVWNDKTSPTFDDLKCERLDFDVQFPIDPFKNYWSPSSSKTTTPVVVKEKRVTSITQLGTPVKAATEPSTPNILTPSKPVIKDAQVLESLREFVTKNSDFTIGTLSELAKREFKGYTKSILKHTIQEVAFYNKKTNTWEIKPNGQEA